MRELTLSERLNGVRNAQHIPDVVAIAILAGGYDWSLKRVQAHMAAELAAAPKAHHWLLHAFSPLLVLGIFALFAGSVVSMFAGIGLMMFDSTWYAPILAVCGCALASTILYYEGSWVLRGPARWVSYNLDDYTLDSIPADGRQIIVKMRVHEPMLEFVVHDLVQNKVSLDPVLEAIAPDGTRCYPYVWKDGKTILPH